jgi:hypothetical protein
MRENVAMAERASGNEGTLMHRRDQRRRGLGFVASIAVSAFAGGAVVYAERAAGGSIGSLNPWLSVMLALLFAVSMAISGWLYLRDADELEWAHNITAGFWGLMVLALIYPVWLILCLGGWTSAPTARGVWAITLLIASAVYLWKRFR